MAEPVVQTTEEKLAEIAALMAQTDAGVAAKPKSFAYPIDPQEREQCQGCQ